MPYIDLAWKQFEAISKYLNNKHAKGELASYGENRHYF
jgi:hypothetical protein